MDPVICNTCMQAVPAVTSEGTCSLCALTAKLAEIRARNDEARQTQSFVDLWRQHVERMGALRESRESRESAPMPIGDPHDIVGLWINGFYMHLECRVDRRHHAPAPDGVIFRQDLIGKAYTCSRCQRPLGR